MAVSVLNRTELIREEFAEKNDILAECGEWLSPWDFYDLLFEGIQDGERVMVIEAGKRFVSLPLEQMLEFSLGRDDVYISPAIYYQNRYKSSFLDKLFAIAVDIDNVYPRMLSRLMRSVSNGEYPIPTMITNSGNGVHFYYVFTEPVRTYRNVRDAARDLYDALHAFFGEGLALTQKHWIGQPYRVVGGLTKAGDTTTAYLTGDKWTPEQLATACNSVWRVEAPADRSGPATDKMRSFAAYLAELKGVTVPDFESFNETHDFIRQNRTFAKVRPDGNFINDSPRCTPKWYEETRSRVLEETQEGHRYSSLMALCVIACKCGVSKGNVESDIDMISMLWRQDKGRWRTPFNRQNIPSALRLYRPEYLKVRRETLEDWLGWKFPKNSCKRNGRSQAEHLDRVALGKKNNSVFRLEAYFRKNPDASQRQAARETGMSRNTIAKYYLWAKSLIK